jgi:hypothetical protein
MTMSILAVPRQNPIRATKESAVDVGTSCAGDIRLGSGAFVELPKSWTHPSSGKSW